MRISKKKNMDPENEKKLEAPGYLHRVLKNKYFEQKTAKVQTVDFGQIIRKLSVYYTRTEVLLIAIGSIAAIVNGTVLPLCSLVFGRVTEGFIDQEKYDFYGSSYNSTFSLSSNTVNESFLDIIWSSCPIYFYAAILSFVLGCVHMICFEYVNMNQIFRLRQVFFAQAMRQDVSWYDRQEEDCDLSTRLVDDTERVKNGLGAKVPLFLHCLGFLVSGLAVGFSKCWSLALIALGVGIILLLASIWNGKSGGESALREQLRYGVAGGIASEVLSSIKVVASFGNQKIEIDRFAKAVYEGKMETRKKYIVLAVCMCICHGFTHAIYATVLSYAGELIETLQISPRTMFVVLMSVVSGTAAIGNSMAIAGDIAAAFSSCSHLFDTIDSRPDADPYSRTGLIISDLKGSIQFKNVFFAYPTRPHTMVLCGLNLNIPAGKVAALVGSSGSGKSTVISMLLRFYDPLSGRVEIDGHDTKEINVSGLRKKIGVVSQEPVLFDVTVEDNIRFGNRDATFEEIEEAAKKANAHQFIKSLTNGYQTVVGERGTMLSGGQKQRIAIARALVRDPKILLLDEATSALDNQSEILVQAALENAMRGRTTVIVAHRLSTIRHADSIFVMKTGQVVEQGTHDDLMAREGAYFHLVQRQRILQEEETVNEHKILNSLTPIDAMQRSSMRRITTLRFQKRKEEKDDDDVPQFTILQMMDLGKPWMSIIAFLLFGILGLNYTIFSLIYGEIIQICAYPIGQIERNFTTIVIYLMILTLIAGTIAAIATLMTSFSTEDMIEGVRNKMFVNILSQSMGFFDKENSSALALTNSLALNPPQIKAVAGLRVGTMIYSVVCILSALILAFIYFWPVALFMTMILPFVLFANFNQARLSIAAYALEDQATKKATKLASECFDNIKTVQFLCLQDYMVETFCNRLKAEQALEKKGIVMFGLTYGLSCCIPMVGYGGCYWIGGVLMVRNVGYTVRGLYASITAMIAAISTIGPSTLFFQDFGRCKIAIGESLKLVNLPKELDPYSESGKKPEIKGKIEFSDVYFSYPTRRSQLVLSGFNLTIEAGQTVALVGGSGCGKSTIVGMLERFYSPTKGSIFIDGTEIRDINLHHLRNHLGLVTQEPMLFDKSIRENIAYGGKSLGNDPDDFAIVKAAKDANIHDFISSLPQGYETGVGERGSKLSGGQKQRVAIARALVRNPKILLLDEATSALDAESEKVVQDALDKASEGRTSIIIAHRLSTVRNADVIVVIQDGVVAEKGTHDELVRMKGKYYELLMHQ